MVVDPSAIRDVNLRHILPPRGYFHQEIIIYLGNTQGEMKENVQCEKLKRQTVYCSTDIKESFLKTMESQTKKIHYPMCLLVVGH